MSIPQKYTWIERARETYNFHVRKKHENDHWTLRDTAKALKRGLGPISEDLLIAHWLKTHKEKLEKFDYAKEALEWIRKEEKKLDEQEIE